MCCRFCALVSIWNNNEFTQKEWKTLSIQWRSHLWHSLFTVANSFGCTDIKKKQHTQQIALFDSIRMCHTGLWINCNSMTVDFMQRNAKTRISRQILLIHIRFSIETISILEGGKPDAFMFLNVKNNVCRIENTSVTLKSNANMDKIVCMH